MTQVEASARTSANRSATAGSSAAGLAASVRTGEARTDRFFRFALGAVRVVNCTTSLIVLAARFDHYRLSALVVVIYVAVVGWSVWLFGWATRGGMVTVRLLAADVVIAFVPLLVVGLLTEPRVATDWTNWSFAYGLSVALVAGAVLRLWAAVAVSAVFAAAYLAGVASALVSGEASLANGLGNALSFFAFALLAFALARHLRRTGAELDAALGRALLAEAEQARYLDRITQYRTLHNTVLATLTGIARGGLDHRAETVRARCERQADYLRRLIEGEVSAPSHPLAEALGDVIDQAAETGLRVHYAADDLPVHLPPEVVRALAGAAEEALENIRRHAGVDEARLNAVGENGQVVVRIVDQGHGFDPAAGSRTFGVTESIGGRMRDSGGTASVISHPGEGTWVELRWPAP
jgi:signal transduction histidine kinase